MWRWMAAGLALTVAACSASGSRVAVFTPSYPVPGAATKGTTTTATVEVVAPPSPGTVPPGWQPGTTTCAELEDDFPVGADDHRMLPQQGILTFWQQPDGEEETIQFLNDPTCTADSEAWRFMIRHLLDPELLYRSGLLCDFFQDLGTHHPPPANLDTVLTRLAPARELCA